MEMLNRHPFRQDATILIVDDEPAVINALRRILRQQGYSQVISCSRGQTALELIEQHRPNLLILDLHMPGMDGFAVLKQLSERYLPTEAPITLVVTGANDRTSRLQALESGARDYLLKPYDPYEVLLRVNNLLDIQQQSRMLGNILDATPVAMLVRDADGRCTYINRRALDLLGYERSDAVIGQDVHALLKHSHSDGTSLPRAECVICTASASQGEAYCWRTDGTLLPVSYWSYPLVFKQASGEHLLTLIDRSEQHASEQRSRLANTVFESVDQPLMITDAQARIVAVNQAYTNLTGWTAAEIVGHNPNFRRSGQHNADFYRAMWRTLLKTGSWQGELWNLRKDGASYLEEIKITTVLDSQGRINHFVAAVRDLTAVRQHAEELETARRHADVANLAKSQFVANMSHEIRTPLTAIVGFAETLTEDNQAPEEHERAVNAIIRNSRYLMELVNDILDLSKIESGKLLVENIPTPFMSWLLGIAALAIERARNKGLEFELTVTAPWPRTFSTDPTRAKQILLNLLSNAFKFTATGSVRLQVALDYARKRLVFDVIDTGIGIDAHRLDELFEAFVQADASTMRQHGGSGLGLNIARTLARQLGGDLTVNSVIGVGSQFTAMLATGPLLESALDHQPLHLASDQWNTALPITTAPTPAEPWINADILLVDDHPDNRDLIGHLLQKAGARVFMAENGQLAFQHAQQRDFDLILMDMQMPVLDGLNATRLLRMSGFTQPIIALTANATLEDKGAALAAGCNDFLTKPINHHRLHDTLARYLPHTPRAVSGDALGSIDRAAEVACVAELPDYAVLRQRFQTELPKTVAALHSAQTAGDLNTVTTLSHQLRGVGSSFGFDEITSLAAQIEDHARRGALAELRPLVATLEGVCQQISR